MDYTELPENVYWPNGNRLLIQETPGEPITPEKRLEIMHPDDFEILVLQWATYFLRKQYLDVKQFAGPGDKGRDIVCYFEPKNKVPRGWDNFQCKHYDHALYPADVWPDIGKLCYYSKVGVYPSIPRKFTFVSSKGFGPTVQDLWQKPDEIRKGLLETFDQWKIVLGKINDAEQTSLKEYIADFDFSIVDGLEPTTLLEQYQQTPYYRTKFGGSLAVRDYTVVVPPEVDETKEARYVEQLLDVYRERIPKLKHYKELNAEPKLKRHFDRSRWSFFKAEMLHKFARDSYPGATPFEELKEQIFEGIQPTLDLTHTDSLEKVNAVCKHATEIQVDANILKTHAQPGDRIGICHHLANDDSITWVEEADAEE